MSRCDLVRAQINLSRIEGTILVTVQFRSSRGGVSKKKRHGPTIFSAHCCSFETKLEPAARERPMQLIAALFIGTPPRESELKHNLNVSRLKIPVKVVREKCIFQFSNEEDQSS